MISLSRQDTMSDLSTYEPTFDDSMYLFSAETKQCLLTNLHQMKSDGSQWKFGTCYQRRSYTRTHDQCHYSRDYFDNDNAKILINGITSDKEGGAIEGFAIAYGKHIGISVNVRNERPGSFGRNPSQEEGADLYSRKAWHVSHKPRSLFLSSQVLAMRLLHFPQ